VEQLGEREPGRVRHAHAVALPHPRRGELASAGIRALVELAVAERSLLGYHGRVVGPRPGRCPEPVVHRQRRTMRKRVVVALERLPAGSVARIVAL
jgi:hypothetical protein